MKPWKRVEPTEIQKVGYRTVVTKHFVLPDGQQAPFQTFNREGIHFAGIIAVTRDNKVITAYQYRVGPEIMMFEVPGGGVDQGEDFQAAAVRELKEETGYVPSTVRPLGKVYKDAYNNGTWHFFMAEGCEPHSDGQQLDEHEHVEVRLLDIADFIEKAKQGLMTDVEAVFLAYDRLQELTDG